MTENEAKEILLQIAYDGEYPIGSSEAFSIAIQALEEIQQYRTIGTIEEFKALKDKSVAKKAEVNEFDYGEGYVCGECESFLHYVDDDEHIRTNYCCHCGTKIDWQ